MAREIRVAGPPGTGKTRYLTRQIAKACEARGEQAVIVASFTKAAATEIAGRIRKTIGKEPRHVGTLHSLCYRMYDSPKIADTMISKWNEECSQPSLKLTGGASDNDDPYSTSSRSQGDRLYSSIQKLRAKMIDLRMWPTHERRFFEAWCIWKDQNGLMDFTDLIEKTLERNLPPPTDVEVAFIDEAQDFTKLEIELIRRWSEAMETFVLCFDDDQCIYSFKGAAPEALLEKTIPEDQKRVLSQSYRVPVAIHGYAEKWISKIANREPKDYRPRPAAGLVERVNTNFRYPDAGLLDRIKENLGRGQEVMILASCSYMLRDVIGALKKHALPYHNPYRVKRGDWNPLRFGSNSTCAKLRTYLKRNPEIAGEGAQLHVWTAKELYSWAKDLTAGAFRKRGSKTELKEFAEAEPDKLLAEDSYFSDNALSWIDHGNIEGFENSLMPSIRKRYEFPITLAKHNPDALSERPNVVIGTIHSVKGAEASSVFVYPDLSPEGFARWQSKSGRDEVRRVFYVAMTRAKEELYLCAPASARAVSW